MLERFYLKERLFKIAGLKYSKDRERVLLIFPGYFQSKDTKIMRRLGDHLFRFFDIICVDMPGHGKSWGFFTFGSYQEEKAFNFVIDYAKRIYSKIGVLAFSLGAMVAVNCARGDLDSLVLVSCPYDFSKIEFKFLSPRAILLGLKSLDLNAGVLPGYPFFPKKRPIEEISKIKTPTLFLHGDKDPIISHKHTIKLAENFSGEKKVYIFRDGNHAEDLFRTYPQSFLKEVISWSERFL